MEILLIDNFDSFTYNLVDYLAQAGARCDVFRNDIPLAAYIHKSYSGVLLSPGPGRPEDAGFLMEVLAYYAERLPLLGVCLGHQAIGVHFGAKLVKGKQPMHGKLSQIQCAGTGLFAKLPAKLQIVRYHSLLLERPLPAVLDVVAQTENGEIMALIHKSLPIWGIQFHPEAALTEHGKAMMANWVALLRNVS